MKLRPSRVYYESGELTSYRERLERADKVREFLMAEIEHFVDPLDKRHARFSEVKDVVLTLLPKEIQQEGKTDLSKMTVGEAVEKVSSERFESECNQLTTPESDR